MEAAQNYSRDDLDNKKYSELQKISKALGIKGGRLKTDKLIEAILEAEAASDFLSEDAGNIATALAEAAVKEDDPMEAQEVKSTDSSGLLEDIEFPDDDLLQSSGLLEDIEFPDDDLLGGLQPTPAKTPGRHTKQNLAVATPKPQSAIKKRGRSVCPDNENVTTPDASSNGTKRRRTETFDVDDEISFPNKPCDVDDEISFPNKPCDVDDEISFPNKPCDVVDEISFPNRPCEVDEEISFTKVVPAENEKVAENTQQLSLLGSQLQAKTPAQVSKRKRGRGRKPALAVQENINAMEVKLPQLRRDSTFDKETSDLVNNEENDSEIRNQSIVREGTYVKDEENKSLVRENTFTKDEPKCKDSTEKLSSNDDLVLPVGEIDDDIITSDCVTEFVANTEESDLPSDDIVTSNNVTEFVAQPTECKTPEVCEPQSETVSFKSQLSVKKSRSNITQPSSARKSLASGNTPGLNRKSLAISRRSNATPLKAQNVRKSIGIMGIHVNDFKKAAGSPVGARLVTPVTKASLTRKSIGTPVAKIVGTPVTRIISSRKSFGTPLGGRKSLGTPLAGKKSIGNNIQLGQKSTSKVPPIKASISKPSTFESKLMKPTFSIGQTAPIKTEQSKKQTGSGIPRFVSYARKIKMPDFSKIHEKAFKRMEALDDYTEKKRTRTRTLTAGGSTKTPSAKTPSSAAPIHVFTPSVTNVKNLNLNFAESARKKTPINMKIATSGKKTTTSKKLTNSATKITSKSPKLVSKSPNGTVKAKKSPKVISTKSPKISNKSPKTKLKPQSAKKEVAKSGIPSLKENVKPGLKNSSSLVESKITAPKPINYESKIPAPKPVNYRPYTGAIKSLNPRKTKEDLKNLAMKNPKVKNSSQVRAENRTILKGVRINKRFEMQMANRGINLKYDS